LDKSILSYSNGDRDLLTSLANKWETVAFTERVIEKVDKMNQLYLYEADKIEKEDAEYLNRIVFLIAILGITGTVAGVISTIDASNDTFNTSLRVSIIVWSTILSGILFGYFLPFLFKLFSKKTKALKK
jgi:flagellar motor component MotA